MNRKDLMEKVRSAKPPRSPPRLTVQEVLPRDQFESCTLSIEQWLANTESNGYWKSNTDKWRLLMEALATVSPLIERYYGLGQEPRIGYDAVRDQVVFIFKANSKGTTYLVSFYGLPMGDAEIIRDD